MKLSEKQIQRQIIEMLNYSGCFVYGQNAGQIPIEGMNGKTRMIKVGKKGIADIIGLRKSDGKFVAIEVKTPERRGNVTFYQQQFLEQVKEYGGITGVATSVEEALEIVK